MKITPCRLILRINRGGDPVITAVIIWQAVLSAA
jgi:hypothetical protein